MPGGPWGEWGPGHLRRVLGYVPERLGRGAHIWHAPAAGYSFSKDGASLASQLFFYIVAGLAGIALIALAVVLLARIVRTMKDSLPAFLHILHEPLPDIGHTRTGRPCSIAPLRGSAR